MGLIDYYMSDRAGVRARAAAFFGRCMCFGETFGPHRCSPVYTMEVDRWCFAFLRKALPESRMHE